MPKLKYNWKELEMEFMTTTWITLKQFIKNKLWDQAFKNNWNYKTHIRNKISSWTSKKEDYWRNFMRDISNFYTNEDLYKYYQWIKKLNNILPDIIDRYIENLDNKKDISLNEIIKIYNFLQEIVNKKETDNKIDPAFKTLI